MDLKELGCKDGKWNWLIIMKIVGFGVVEFLGYAITHLVSGMHLRQM
jgi:hypothetical protein